MSQVKDKVYYDRVYSECSGVFHPFRDHYTEFGWGIMHTATCAIFGYIGDKGACFGVCAALNGNWEAAQEFLKDSSTIPDSYFERFGGKTVGQVGGSHPTLDAKQRS